MYLGIEIGGTKLQAAIGPGTGSLANPVERREARPAAGREGICRQLADLVPSTLAKAGLHARDLAGVGVGFGGPVDTRRGIVMNSHQVEGWKDFPLSEWFKSELGLTIALGNDSDLAGLAEAHFGAGKGFSPVAYMNIGSGIGGALVVDGKLYAGQGRGSMEIGHLRFPSDGENGPGRTLESLCSGWSLAEHAKGAADAHPNSALWRIAGGKRADISTECLVQAVRERDPAAISVWETAIRRLGVAVANVMTLLNPARFVIGGGVALVGDLLFEPLQAEVERQGFAPFAHSYRIVAASLREEVVLHGALKLAQDGFA